MLVKLHAIDDAEAGENGMLLKGVRALPLDARGYRSGCRGSLIGRGGICDSGSETQASTYGSQPAPALLGKATLPIHANLHKGIWRSICLVLTMFSSRDIVPPSRQPCYFSITPGRTHTRTRTASTISGADTSVPSPDNLSPETPTSSPDYHGLDSGFGSPVADPSNPLLAFRPTPPSPYTRTTAVGSRMDASKLLQLQTQASHQPTRAARPQPRPVQDVLVVSDGAASSNSSAGSTAAESSSSFSRESAQSTSSLVNARCSRCHRTPSLDVATGKSNMVNYGLNLFYCTRCAAIVGLGSR